MEEEECSSFKFQDFDRFFEVESYSTIHLKPTSHNKLFKYEYRNLNYKSPSVIKLSLLTVEIN